MKVDVVKELWCLSYGGSYFMDFCIDLEGRVEFIFLLGTIGLFFKADKTYVPSKYFRCIKKLIRFHH